jgi:hypothetical protein
MPVTFTEENHRYTSHEGEVYTSVTTLLKKFTPPFDADYWSAYKALQAVLGERGEWEKFKRKVGGWENVVTAARLDKKFPYRKEVIEKKREILQMWEETKEDALTKGTAYHKMKEAAVKEKIVYTPELREVPVVSDVDILQLQNFDDDGLFPELVVYNDEWKIAGQADWVMKQKRKVDIKDYKTSREIKKTGFQDSKLLYPVHHLPNANFYVYSLQLSLYARMIEAKGYRIGQLSIEHVDKNTFKTIEIYPVNYYKKEAEDIIAEHVRASKKRK